MSGRLLSKQVTNIGLRLHKLHRYRAVMFSPTGK